MKKLFLTGILVGLSLVSCTPDAESIAVESRVGSLPLFPIEPDNNITTTEKVALGRTLFWDPIMSGNKDVACATCHHPNNAYADNLPISVGVLGQGLAEDRTGPIFALRNSPTVLNSGYIGIDSEGDYDPSNTALFWDSRAKSLEEQALGPLDSQTEMRGDVFAPGTAVDSVVARLNKIQEYKTLFASAFGTEEINGERIGKAIAAFERTLTSNNSRFDRYARGDDSALNAEEIRGLQAFNASKCNECHSGPMFSDFKLHNLGVVNNDVANPNDNGNGQNMFRTPPLRNVALTAPYMHSGVEGTLEEAVGFYDRVDKSLDPDLEKLNLDDSNQDAIVAFLKTLTDEDFDRTIPTSVPSGLNPGGNIE
ncbi:cytochrome-c peroxidase [Flavobacteriaceae bacterium UJ101]|nr:cytochrome-c peroxidase [Flavobacteriaceae bacterium UJ101]